MICLFILKLNHDFCLIDDAYLFSIFYILISSCLWNKKFHLYTSCANDISNVNSSVHYD